MALSWKELSDEGKRNVKNMYKKSAEQSGIRTRSQMWPGSRRLSRPFSRCCAAAAQFGFSGRPTQAGPGIERTRESLNDSTFAHRPGRRFPLIAKISLFIASLASLLDSPVRNW